MSRNNDTKPVIRELITATKGGKVRSVKEAVKKLLSLKIRKRLQEKEKELSKRLVKEEALQEDVIDQLRNIVTTKTKGKIRFDSGQNIDVDLFTASAVLGVYDALTTPEVKQKLVRMANKNVAQFMKVVDFSFNYR